MDDFAQIRRLHRDGLSARTIARQLGVGRDTVRKALNQSEPTPYTLSGPRPAPVFGPFRGVVDAILDADRAAPPKQRHTAQQVFRRLAAEHAYTGGYDQVRRYLQQLRRSRRETFIPLGHPPGHLTPKLLVRSSRLFALSAALGAVLLGSDSGRSVAGPLQKAEAKEKLLATCRAAWAQVTAPPAGLVAEATFTVTDDGKQAREGTVVFVAKGERYRADMSLRITPAPGQKELKDLKVVVLREPGLVFYAHSQKSVDNRGRAFTGYLAKEDHVLVPPAGTLLPTQPFRALKSIDPEKLKLADVKEAFTEPNGDLVFKCSTNGIKYKFVCSKDSAYNVTLTEVYRGDFGDTVSTSETVKWQQVNDVWCPAEIVRTNKLWREEGKPPVATTLQLRYTRYELQAKVEDSSFSLDSLGMPEGTRVLDVRPGAATKEHRYEKGAAGKGLGDAFDALPVVPRGPSAAQSSPRWLALVNGAGILCLTLGGVAPWRRRRPGRE